MTSSVAPPASGGYGWDMNASRKLDARLDEVMGRETAPTLGDLAPVSWRERVAQTRHATDEEMAAAEAATRDE